MSESSRELLRRMFLLRYDDIKLRLTRRLGSAELASDALQDTWLRLEHPASIGPVFHPLPFILRIAHNIALKRLRGERARVTLDEVREELNLVDDAPTAAEITEARAELTLLMEAVQELTPRRRDILFAARLDGCSLQQIARRFGIPERSVARELRRALLHCAERVDRKALQRRGPRPRDAAVEGDEE